MGVTSTSGQGRPKGVPNRNTAEIRALARVYGPEVIFKLAQFAGVAVDDYGNKIAPAAAEATQMAALKELLDRGYGKAVQPQSGPDGETPVQQVVYQWALPAAPAGEAVPVELEHREVTATFKVVDAEGS